MIGLFVLGIVLILAGISISIGLHELGHLVPAKRFGVKVTEYMIGFGPTLVSFTRGETRYGIKLLPLGGYIAMPGMYPPEEATHARAEELGPMRSARAIVTADAARRGARAEPEAGAKAGDGAESGAPRRRRARLFERSIVGAREYSNESVAPGEEGRTFYALSVPKRLTVMFGGPFVNLVLGVVFLAVVLMGIGLPGLSTQIGTVVDCAVDAQTLQSRGGARECRPGDPQSPASRIGLKPGDIIVAVDGEHIESWEQLQRLIAERAGTTAALTYARDGAEHTAHVPIIATERQAYTDSGEPLTHPDGRPVTKRAGFLGVSPQQRHYPISVAEFPSHVGSALQQTFTALVTLPKKLVQVGTVALGQADRDPNGPIGIVGVGRVAGEIASDNRFALVEKAQLGLSLLASLNFFLFAFNMVPLLPLDGGHIAVGLYEGLRRRVSLLRGRGNIGPFDTAKLLPVTYGVVGLMLAMTALLTYVDIVKPIVLFG